MNTTPQIQTIDRNKRIKLIALLTAILILVLAFSAYLLVRPHGMAHYLLIGIDGWGLNQESAGRSDVIMLASLDYDNRRIALTSFARDSAVLPSWRTTPTKLNTLVRSQERGEDALIDYIEETYNIPIDGKFVVNFSAAVDIIDTMGGVTVSLASNEVTYLRKMAGDYDGYRLREGDCLMNGAQALAFMRCRKLDSDFGRQDRQVKVLRAMMDQVSHVPISKIFSLFNDVRDMYRTDMSTTDQITLVKNAIYLRKGDIDKYAIPAEGTFRYSSIDGASALKFDLEENQALFRTWLGLPEQAKDEQPDNK